MTALRLVPPPEPPAPLDYETHDGRPVAWAPWKTALTLPGMSYCCECCLYEGAPWACVGIVDAPRPSGLEVVKSLPSGAVPGVRWLLAFQCPDCRDLRVYDTAPGRSAATSIDITNPQKETGS